EYTLFTTEMIEQLSYSLPLSLEHLSFNLSITQDLLQVFLSGCFVQLKTLELFNIHAPNRKISLYIMEYYNRIGSLNTLKLSKTLLDKYVHNRKKRTYKIIETTPDWFQEPV